MTSNGSDYVTIESRHEQQLFQAWMQEESDVNYHPEDGRAQQQR